MTCADDELKNTTVCNLTSIVFYCVEQSVAATKYSLFVETERTVYEKYDIEHPNSLNCCLGSFIVEKRQFLCSRTGFRTSYHTYIFLYMLTFTDQTIVERLEMQFIFDDRRFSQSILCKKRFGGMLSESDRDRHVCVCRTNGLQAKLIYISVRKFVHEMFLCVCVCASY